MLQRFSCISFLFKPPCPEVNFKFEAIINENIVQYKFHLHFRIDFTRRPTLFLCGEPASMSN